MNNRVRYDKPEQAPVLLDTVIKLGIQINGAAITAASSDADKLLGINKLQDDTNSYTNTETSIFIENLANKVLISQIFTRLQFRDPISETFFKSGVSFSAAKEIFDSKVLKGQKFDRDKRYPDKQGKSTTLNVILQTVKTDYLTNTVQTAGLQAAFASEQAYGQWMAKQVDLLSESLQLELFVELQKLVKAGIKNEITLDAAKFTTWDEIFIEITRIANNMKIPSIKYNMGFADPTDPAVADKVRVNITQISEMIFMASTDIENAIKGKVSAIKYHNEYFKTDKFAKVIALDQDSDEVELVAPNAFDGYFRVKQFASQAWASNLSLEYFLHYWYVFGSIPWANGVRIKFTNPDA